MPEKKISLPAWLQRGMADLFPDRDENVPDQNLAFLLKDAERKNKQLRVKLGIDPTGTDIHIGHSILFRKLRAFQDAGHKAVLIIGDFTAQIGDPTGKSDTRNKLNYEQVEANSNTYLEQLGLGKDPELSLLDFSTPGKLEVHKNSAWLSDLDLSKVIDLLSTATVGQMLAKEDFANRYGSNSPISLHEFLYPLLQGYDSVAVDADIELGGTDQKFNVAIGRDLQKYNNKKPQFGLLLPILIGIDGVQKMSKSLGNTVGLNEDPVSMYSKLEKVPDSLVRDYLTLLTNLDVNALTDNPRELQKIMALTVTSNFHGKDLARGAQTDCEKLVSGSSNLVNTDVLEVSISKVKFPAKIFYLISALGLCSSSSEARRQIKGGAVRIDGKKIIDSNYEFLESSEILGKILQIGKKTFRRIIS